LSKRAGKHGTFHVGASGSFCSQNDPRFLVEDPATLQHPGEIKKHVGAFVGTISRCVDQVLKQGPVDV
jgi:hypothetical protein